MKINFSVAVEMGKDVSAEAKAAFLDECRHLLIYCSRLVDKEGERVKYLVTYGEEHPEGKAAVKDACCSLSKALMEVAGKLDFRKESEVKEECHDRQVQA